MFLQSDLIWAIIPPIMYRGPGCCFLELEWTKLLPKRRHTHISFICGLFQHPGWAPLQNACKHLQRNVFPTATGGLSKTCLPLIIHSVFSSSGRGWLWAESDLSASRTLQMNLSQNRTRGSWVSGPWSPSWLQPFSVLQRTPWVRDDHDFFLQRHRLGRAGTV